MASRRHMTPPPVSQRTATFFGDSSWESFNKLFASVADPQTQKNHARHLALTKNILYENEAGWKVAELSLVSDLLLLLRNKVLDGVPQFAEQLVLAITRCCKVMKIYVEDLDKPFVRQKSNEEITNPSLFHGLLPTLGELLSFEDIEVQVTAAEALRMFATGACLARPASKSRNNNADSKSDDLRLTPRIFSQNLLEETGTVDAIVAVMHDLFPDGELVEEEQEFPQDPEPVEGDPEMDEDQVTTNVENSNEQSGEELKSDGVEDAKEMALEGNGEVDAEDTVLKEDNMDVEDMKEENNVARPAVKPLSAPPNGHKGPSQLDARSREWNVITKENESSTARTTKPASAPSTIHRGLNNSRVAKANHTEDSTSAAANSQGATPEQDEPTVSRPGSPQENQHSGATVEEELVQVIGNALPIQMRLSVLLFPLIDLLYELSGYQRCAEVLVVSGALHYVVFILENTTNPQDELLPLCLEILWNVLELSQEKISTVSKVGSRKELLEVFRLRNATFFLGNEFTFQALLHVLELLLAQGYRQQDKEMRNECLMILQLLAKRRRSLDFFYSTGLTACLFSYATAAELSHAKGPGNLPGRFQNDKSSATASAITASSQYYATNSDEDFEFKQMLWFLLAEISCDHQANLSELVQFRFMEIWLSYATDNNNQHQDSGAFSRASAHKYSAPQLQVLQWTALSVLNHVAPFVLEHFYEIGGHAKLLDFLQLNMGTEDVLASAWLLLLQVSPPLPFFQSELGKLGAIETAMEIFEGPPSRHTFVIRRNAILACASMCRNDDGSNRERFRRANGVLALVQHLAFDPSHSVLEENILVGIIDAVRSCVIGDIESETAFINDDGVPKLLSIVGTAPKALKHQALAALAEVSVHPAAIPSYQMWRCDQHGENYNTSANEMLLRIYAEEEAAEKRANQDIVDNDTAASQPATNLASSNVRHCAFQSITHCRSSFIIAPEASSLGENPLSPPSRPESPAFARLKDALKAAQGFSQDKQSSRSVLSLESHQVHPEVNLRAKIYSVLANVSFACETESLSPQDQVMLEIAKEYPTFKLGEMWQNVERTLHAEGNAYDISVCTKLAQQEVFARSRQRNTEREDEFFMQILRQKHQEAQAEQFHRANRRHNSTMQLHLDAKKTRLEFMRRQDPAAFAAYESEERCLIRDPPPEYVDEQEGLRALQQHEAELRGRLSTIKKPRNAQIVQNLVDADHTVGCFIASVSRIFSINTADV
ncbi:Armadillo-type fold [Phytophthora cactorum]|nr:Armadillo-type fold [Phytophthora cactorum]